MITFKGRTIRRIGVVGSGQIGPDIALYFTKVFTPHDVPVVVVDVSAEALERGRSKMEKKIDRGVQTGAFKPDFADAMKRNVTFTDDYEALRGASLVVEAASESQPVKAKIFEQLETLCDDDAVLASNSSHMEPEVIFADLASRSRALVIHYFFPAERNPIVEVVPGADTRAEVADWVMDFYEWMGKVPLRVRSRYGYAIDPVFEGIFQAAALCVEEGLGTTKEVDAVAREALGLGVGPFTAMNLTGGNPITAHGLDEMHTKVMPWFRTPQILRDQLAAGTPWDVPGRGETVDVEPERRERIADAMRGAYFGLVGEVLDSGIVSLSDLELGVETALVVAAPFRTMNEVGVERALELVERYAADHEGFVVAECLRERARSGQPWRVPVVLRENRGDVAILRIRRPAVLNAVNAETIAQLAEAVREARDDDSIRAIVLTGYGRKAFVSGADIGFLSTLETPEDGERMCLNFQGAIQEIADCPKPVVCALNGLAFGGGCEIAMGCHARIARADLRVLAAQPEVNLGIIPGAGGTQRMPRLIGIEKGAELLRTGRPVSPQEALELGLVDRLSEGDLVDDAVALAHEIVEGRFEPVSLPTGPIDAPERLPDVDIGHLSRAVDAILCRAILEGARMTLADGLRLEAKLFGEVLTTEDSRIGIRNFIEKGARSKAEFVHR